MAYQIAFRAVFLRPARPCALTDYFLHLSYDITLDVAFPISGSCATEWFMPYAARHIIYTAYGVTSATVSAKDATALASFDLLALFILAAGRRFVHFGNFLYL